MQDSNIMHQTFAAAVLTDNVRCIMLLSCIWRSADVCILQ